MLALAAALLIAVPLAVACTPPATGGGGGGGPQVDAVSIAFTTRPDWTATYCVSSGNSSGVIKVKFVNSNATLTGNLISVTFDRDPATNLAVGATASSAAFAAGSCHDVTVAALVAPMTPLLIDLQITH